MHTSDKRKDKDAFDCLHDALCAELYYGCGAQICRALYERVHPEESYVDRTGRIELEKPIWVIWPGRKQGGDTRTLPSAWLDFCWTARYVVKPARAGLSSTYVDACVFAEVKTHIESAGAVLRQMRLYKHLLGAQAIGVLFAPAAELARQRGVEPMLRAHGFLVEALDVPAASSQLAVTP